MATAYFPSLMRLKFPLDFIVPNTLDFCKRSDHPVAPIFRDE